MTPEIKKQSKTHILSLEPDKLIQMVRDMGQPSFRGEQLVDWIFRKRVCQPERMTNLPKAFRESLVAMLDWSMPEVVSSLHGEDGATKLLLRGALGMQFEAVILRYKGRTSLCVSSQVGCRLACTFCQTGKLGFFRHLRSEEIVAQFMLANQILERESKRITHIVFMGMGEPLDNFENVASAVRLFTSPGAYGLSSRRVTVSTSGIAPAIAELAERVGCSLAISLHAARDELRSELMPLNRRYPLASLKKALLLWQRLTGQKITIEYILIKDRNASSREAKELVKFLHGLRAKVNLIPFNSHPGLPFQRPSEYEISMFQSYLSSRGYPSPVRYSKGLAVSAACGQLAAKCKNEVSAVPVRRNIIAKML